MHGVSFWFKRAHWSAVRLGRAVVGPFGLTPARFDVLFLLEQGVLAQSALRRLLGVARSTMSTMVRRLVELGLVVRKRAGDRRTWGLDLTAEGRRRIRRAIREAIGSGLVQLVYESAFGRPGWSAMLSVGTVEGTAALVARHLGDDAAPIYLDDIPDH
jgi:DNA-binding MarR family transcriptional regulator